MLSSTTSHAPNTYRLVPYDVFDQATSCELFLQVLRPILAISLQFPFFVVVAKLLEMRARQPRLNGKFRAENKDTFLKVKRLKSMYYIFWGYYNIGMHSEGTSSDENVRFTFVSC